MKTTGSERPLRVLYSFPHKMGAGGVCYAAWQQVKNLSDAGAAVTVFPGVLQKPLPAGIRVKPTLSRGRLRIPYKVFGRMGSCRLHDWVVARRLREMADQIDLVHGFPLGCLETFKVAKELGIPSVMDRCNAHTRFAYEVVEKECELIGIKLPEGHSHAFNAEFLRREEEEYAAADSILCPSEFVKGTFMDQGFPPVKLERFRYGYDESRYYPSVAPAANKPGLTVLFAAGCAPRKGLHYALEAWLKSTACNEGKFLVAGEFVPGYAEKLSEHLSHPSVSVLGFRDDLPEIMRASDVMVLPSIEEGSALVTYDARGAGCVLLVSDSTGAICEHGKNALVHRTRDVGTLARHFSQLHEDRSLLAALRAASLETVKELTWSASGRSMLEAYQRIVARYRRPSAWSGMPAVDGVVA